MSSGFVSSSELNEEMEHRQQEWERVRKPEDPVEAPEPEVCNKSLYEQLQINKEKKDLEFQESKSLKNFIRGIDEDESQFLSMVNDIQRKDDKAKKEEEMEMLRQMRQARNETLPESTAGPCLPLRPVAVAPVEKKSRQAVLISTLIRRKTTTTQEKEPDEKKKKEEIADGVATAPSIAPSPSIPKTVSALPGLADYGSDDDDEGEE